MHQCTRVRLRDVFFSLPFCSLTTEAFHPRLSRGTSAPSITDQPFITQHLLLSCKFLSFRRPPLPPIMLHWTVPSQASSSLDSALIITVVSAADIGSVFTTALKQPLFRCSPFFFPPGDFAAKKTLACVLQSAVSRLYVRVCSTLETGILW